MPGKLDIKPRDILIISDEVGYIYIESVEEGISLEIRGKDKINSIANTNGGFIIRWHNKKMSIESSLSKKSKVKYTLHKVYRYNKGTNAFENIWSSI